MEIKQFDNMKKILHKLTGWLVKKTGYALQQPIQPIIIQPQDLKRLHCQHLVDWFEYKNSPLTPDCFVQGFKYQVVNDLLNEIIIKAEETPDGVLYSCDLLMKNI